MPYDERILLLVIGSQALITSRKLEIKEYILLEGIKTMAAEDFTEPFLKLIWKFQNTSILAKI